MREKASSTERFPRLGDRLAAAGRRRFCGRERELRLFHDALIGGSAPFSLFYVHGLGGIGKSALLDACAQHAAREGVTTVHVDARNIEASPRGFLHAVAEGIECADTEAALDRIGREESIVVTLDSCDALAAIEPWLRRKFLPMLPGAGRRRDGGTPAAVGGLGGRSRVGTDLPSPAAAEPLSGRESRAAADRRVPDGQHDAVLEFTHGHPLALVLVADVIGHADSDCRSRRRCAPNVVRELLARLIATVPSSRHRRALEACAQVRVTTEALLGAALDDSDPGELFDWLRGLSFVEQSVEGLFPHDLAREVLDADFRWRDPDGYLEVHRRVWRHLRQKLVAASGRVRQRVFFDKLYLHRASATGVRFHHYATLGKIYGDVAGPQDRPAILDTVRRHEGEESARIAEHWLDRQPQAFHVARGSDEHMLGLVASIALSRRVVRRRDDRSRSPGLWAFARRRGRLRAGEEMVHHRFHMSCDLYQQMSPIINLLASRATFAPLEHKRLAWSFVTFAYPEPILPLMRYINFERAAEADFTVGGRRYTTFAHDWRVESFEAWWDNLCERSLSTEPVGADAPRANAASVVVLSEPEFAACVRQALRDYTRPAALAANPLIQSRLVADAAGKHRRRRPATGAPARSARDAERGRRKTRSSAAPCSIRFFSRRRRRKARRNVSVFRSAPTAITSPAARIASSNGCGVSSCRAAADSSARVSPPMWQPAVRTARSSAPD